MTSKTYIEKLRDPRWQRKRLERMEESQWACDSCGDTSSTLNVHHKDYFKGREPWEYDIGQLSTLCEACHKEHHDEEDALLVEASYVGHATPFGRESAASLLAGYMMRPMAGVSDPDAYMHGELICWMPKNPAPEYRGLSLQELRVLVEAVKADGAGFIDALRAFAGLTYVDPKEADL